MVEVQWFLPCFPTISNGLPGDDRCLIPTPERRPVQTTSEAEGGTGSGADFTKQERECTYIKIILLLLLLLLLSLLFLILLLLLLLLYIHIYIYISSLSGHPEPSLWTRYWYANIDYKEKCGGFQGVLDSEPSLFTICSNIYIYIYLSIYLSIYLYIHTHIYIYVYIHICHVLFWPTWERAVFLLNTKLVIGWRSCWTVGSSSTKQCL